MSIFKKLFIVLYTIHWYMYIFILNSLWWCASGCVVECRICNREVAGSNFSLGNFAPRSTQPSIHPGLVNEYQLWLGRQRQVWLIPIAGWTCGCAGKTVKSLENTCHTWALLRWWFTTKRSCIECMHLYPLYPLNLRAAVVANRSITASMLGVSDRCICSNIRHTMRFTSIEALSAV